MFQLFSISQENAPSIPLLTHNWIILHNLKLISTDIVVKWATNDTNPVFAEDPFNSGIGNLNIIYAFCDSLKAWYRVLCNNLQFICKESFEMNTPFLCSRPMNDISLFAGYFDLSLMNSVYVKLCRQHARICYQIALSFYWFMFSHLWGPYFNISELNWNPP
jgi:hypothetical protein